LFFLAFLVSYAGISKRERGVLGLKNLDNRAPEDGGLGAELPAAGGYGGLRAKPPAAGSYEGLGAKPPAAEKNLQF